MPGDQNFRHPGKIIVPRRLSLVSAVVALAALALALMAASTDVEADVIG